MPFPASDRVLFERNPLAEVICQLQFPAILQIASELPSAFQERIRGAYPGFQQALAISGLNLPGAMAQAVANMPMGGMQPTPTYSFTTQSESRTVTLTRDALTISERSYVRWEELRAEVETVRAALEEVYAPPYYTRLGLRYQNILKPDELELGDAEWADLLNPAIAGLLGTSEPIRRNVRAIAGAAEVELAELPGAVVRVQYGLGQTAAGVRPPFAIDADFFTTERSDRDRVVPTLDAFHTHADHLFLWAITDRLRDALRPTPLARERTD
jgi:uncharacterized protein (TIGR04255 family)